MFDNTHIVDTSFFQLWEECFTIGSCFWSCDDLLVFLSSLLFWHTALTFHISTLKRPSCDLNEHTFLRSNFDAFQWLLVFTFHTSFTTQYQCNHSYNYTVIWTWFRVQNFLNKHSTNYEVALIFEDINVNVYSYATLISNEVFDKVMTVGYRNITIRWHIIHLKCTPIRTNPVQTNNQKGKIVKKPRSNFQYI